MAYLYNMVWFELATVRLNLGQNRNLIRSQMFGGLYTIFFIL